MFLHQSLRIWSTTPSIGVCRCSICQSWSLALQKSCAQNLCRSLPEVAEGLCDSELCLELWFQHGNVENGEDCLHGLRESEYEGVQAGLSNDFKRSEALFGKL